MAIEDARRLPANAQDSIRMRAAQSVLDCKTQVEASATFGVSRVAEMALGAQYQRLRHHDLNSDELLAQVVKSNSVGKRRATGMAKRVQNCQKVI